MTEQLTYTFYRECLGQSVTVKLPKMRKEKNFSIYPIKDDAKYIYLQSDSSCLAINRADGKTVYSNKGNAPMDYYLTFKRTAEYTLPMQFVADIEKAVKGDSRYSSDGTVVISFTN